MRLAHFWAAALRWHVRGASVADLALVPADGTPFEILFEPLIKKTVLGQRIFRFVKSFAMSFRQSIMRDEFEHTLDVPDECFFDIGDIK